MAGGLLIGCDGSSKSVPDTITEARGGRYYGGVFRLSEPEFIRTLFPLSIIDVYSYRVASQVYEGLFKFRQDSLYVVESLVDEFTLDSTQTVYTFKLKQNVYFHDDECFEGGKGRKMTAEDVRYAFTMACTQSRLNQSFNLFEGIVKGADEYYQATANGNTPSGGVAGFTVLDEHTLQIELVKPNAIFKYNLARPGAFIFPKEAYDRYGEEMRIKCVGTGPFRLSSLDEEVSINLRKNENYHGTDVYGNKLPFLSAISIKFLNDKKVELLEFRKGNLEMMYRLPTDAIIEVMEEAENVVLQREPEMSTQFLALNNDRAPFNNISFRKAVSFAIDREKILDYVLSGEGYGEGKNGITPPVFPFYHIDRITGYRLNIDSANFYLRKAGYKSGKDVPPITLELNSEGERFTNVAVEIKKQLKEHLDIELEINMTTMSQATEKATSGKYGMLRLSWLADYPSPENYLWAFYSKGLPPIGSEDKTWPNLTRYRNSEFDRYYEYGLTAKTEEESTEMFLKAEQLVMQDAAIVVLWYDEAYRLVQHYVREFPNNPMQYRDFSEVYMVPQQKPQ